MIRAGSDATGGDGLAEIQRALELDPLSPVVVRYAGWYASLTGDHERGIELLRRALDLSPDSVPIRLSLVSAYASAGREAEALRAVLAPVPLRGQAQLLGAYASGGVRAFREALLRMEQQRTGMDCPPQPGAGASMHAALGDAEGVFRCLEERVKSGDSALTMVDPVFAPYRSDPRHAAYLKAINLSR